MTMSWQAKAEEKRAKQAALIPDSLKLKNPPGEEVLNVVEFPFDSVLSARDVEITNVEDITTLLAKVGSGEWSATEVTRAFCTRALVAHQLVSCTVCAGVQSRRCSLPDTVNYSTGQLPHRDLCRASHGACR
jgi:amidase